MIQACWKLAATNRQGFKDATKEVAAMADVRLASYGSWPSPITSDLIVAETIALSEMWLDEGDVYWLEGRPREAGRYVLVRQDANGQTSDVTPTPFNVRTRVHEYGGGAYTVHAGVVYFSHYQDQRLYRQFPGAAPKAITPPPPEPANGDMCLRFADGLIDAGRQRWIGVREDHLVQGREAVNTLVSLDLSGAEAARVLVEGADFYSTPRLSPDGKRLAWLSWNHPNMPWMGTELWVAEFAANGDLTEYRQIAGGPAESIFQPEWSPDGFLHYISDRSGWWNLYREETGQSLALYPLSAEFGQPQWVFGMSTYAFLSAEQLVCTYTQNGLDRLALLDLTTRQLTPLDLPFTNYHYLRASCNRVAFRAGSATEPASIVALDVATRTTKILARATSVASNPQVSRYFSRPQPIEFPTEGGKTAHGLYYPPCNPDCTPLAGEKPPLVVKCHGGPTGMASSILDLRIQFWTSRGVAVLDVNYGGSTGYGREYRDRLHLTWGVVDVDDCVNGARHLASQGLADAERMVITGGSAGGYTTLAALAFRDTFKGGGSHYGVSDLEALFSDTHKFESRYDEYLIGPYPAAKEVYRQRSPINHVDRLTAPVIFFQGDEDRVVPPNQAERMVQALRRKGVPVGYLLFAGEQHGFRKAENIKRALDAELYFYAVLVFKTALMF
jgi:dipeptidyl aminopeptidase/acylaminoacyl peptidase